MVRRVYVFVSNSGDNWTRTITKPVLPRSLAPQLSDEECRILESAKNESPLISWGARASAEPLFWQMTAGDVVFGSRRRRIHFGAEVVLAIHKPRPQLSAALWGTSEWPWIFFMNRAVFRFRNARSFLSEIGEAGSGIRGFRVSKKASEVYQTYSSAARFIEALLPTSSDDSEEPVRRFRYLETRDSWRSTLLRGNGKPLARRDRG